MRNVLFVEELSASSLELAIPPGWRITRVEQAHLALFWLRHTPPDLILIGCRFADLSATQLVRAIKCDHAGSLLPLVQIRSKEAEELVAEPDAWVDPTIPGALDRAFSQALTARAERLRDGTQAEMRLLLPSDLGCLDELIHVLNPWFVGAGFGKHTAHHLTLAVRELAANSIEWGHKRDRTRSVSIQGRLDAEMVSILVRDSGPGFDLTRLAHAARPGDPLSHLSVRESMQLREGGFGILMTRSMVDQLCYNEMGNEARLIKYRSGRSRTRSVQSINARIPQEPRP